VNAVVQPDHESAIEAAHNALLTAEAPEERRAWLDHMVELINARDPAVVAQMEGERLARVGL
jgi:acyl-CoA reductase-like NAD-dependent aldehyde dehydrogenase